MVFVEPPLALPGSTNNLLVCITNNKEVDNAFHLEKKNTETILFDLVFVPI